MWRLLASFVLVVLFFGWVFFLSSDYSALDSPIPKIFGTTQKTQEIINTWFPKQTSFDSSLGTLNLSAASAISVDYDTSKVIFAKNHNDRRPVASTVKIMTALVALENARLSDVYTVSEKAASVGENSMGLTVGEKLSLEELLYGLMLVSGNDAAVTIAEGVSLTEDAFVVQMNAKAKELGLVDTKFANASGLDDDNRVQYSSAYDMATLAHFTWEKYPVFRQISSSIHHFEEATAEHKAFDLYNDTNLLTTYPGVKGIKPGFTWEAGLCLVTYAENNGKKILAVVLGSDDRRGEMKELLDYSFGTFGIGVSHPALD